MRRNFAMVTVAAMLSLFVACAEKKPVPPPETPRADGTPGPIQAYVKEGKAPQWVTQKGAAFSGDRAVFYGVGNTAGLINPGLKRKAAEASARRDLAQEFQVYIAALQKQYTAETTGGSMDRHSIEQHIEDVMKQVTEQTLSGSSIVEYWEHPDRNEAYALARLDLSRFEDMVAGIHSNDQQFQKLDDKIKETIKQNAEKLHQQMASELKQKAQVQPQ
jgi:hypothetical protein